MKFACKQCGACCRSTADFTCVIIPIEHRAELERKIAGKTEGRKKLYRIISDDGVDMTVGLFGRGTACPFLVDRRCSIYDGRSSFCRLWPYGYPESYTAKRVRERIALYCQAMREVLRDEELCEIQGLAEEQAGGVELHKERTVSEGENEALPAGDRPAERGHLVDGCAVASGLGRDADDGTTRVRRARRVKG